MSQNHRLITLKDDRTKGIKSSQNLKQIIFGIWLNLKNEKPTLKKKDLDFLLEKNKILIYKKCLEFILLSDKIKTIYSPNENTFLLVIFYYGIQCHYEVRVNKNNKNVNKTIFSNFENKWIVSKKKFEIDIYKLSNLNFEFDLKEEIENEKNNNIIINLDSDFIGKKFGINYKSLYSKSLNKENPNENKNTYNVNNYKDNLCEIFNDSVNLELDEDEDLYNLYNFPKPIISKNEGNNLNNNKNNNINNNYNKDKNKKLIQNKISGISQESTNIYSNKISNSISKNHDISLNDKIINPYSSFIIKQGEKIKKLKNQVEKIELLLNEVMNELDDEKEEKIYENHKLINSKNKNKEKNYLVDQSIKVPYIIYKELSNDDDDE